MFTLYTSSVFTFYTSSVFTLYTPSVLHYTPLVLLHFTPLVFLHYFLSLLFEKENTQYFVLENSVESRNSVGHYVLFSFSFPVSIFNSQLNHNMRKQVFICVLGRWTVK